MDGPLRATATRYVQPLREGGSLPAVVDTDQGAWVVKFRGAGQGPRALVAELIVGLLARHLGLPVPELAVVDVPEPFGRSEPDPEIQDILRGSRGLNVGLRYLDGAFNFDGLAAGDLVSPDLAADVVWLDAFLTNPDRTAHNPNIMVWDGRPWLIDHGAALFAHHSWGSVDEAKTRRPFTLIESHVLLTAASDPAEADERLAPRLDEAVFRDVLAAVPDALLSPPDDDEFATADDARERYVTYLATRHRSPRAFVEEARRARDARLLREPTPYGSRR